MDAETKSYIKEEIESLGIMIAKGFKVSLGDLIPSPFRRRLQHLKP